MSKGTYGNAQTIYSVSRGLYGVRARVNLPTDFSAAGRDASHYFDSYIAVFVDHHDTALVEAGPMFYGEYHQTTPSSAHTLASFPHRWSIGVNPVGGAFKGQMAQGERNVVYAGPNNLMIELTVQARDEAQVKVNGQPFKTPNSFTYGFGGTGVETSTFGKGFNVKACIGLNDEGGGGVRFKDMSVEITQVLRETPHGRTWGPPPHLLEYLPLKATKTTRSGPKITVSYPDAGRA